MITSSHDVVVLGSAIAGLRAAVEATRVSVDTLRHPNHRGSNRRGGLPAQ